MSGVPGKGRQRQPLSEVKMPMAKLRRELDAIHLGLSETLSTLLTLNAGKLACRVRELRQDLGEAPAEERRAETNLADGADTKTKTERGEG
jgi:hypothetical protein